MTYLKLWIEDAKKLHHQLKELTPIEKNLCQLVKIIKFRRTINSLQNKIREDLNNRKQSNKTLVIADKASSLYKT